MRAFARHRLIRFATLFLLAWITVDLCWPDACAGDAFDGAVNPPSTFSHSHESGPKQQGLLHPDHCFCHARSVTLEAFVLISAPSLSSAIVPTSDMSLPAATSPAIYHPPQALL